MPAKPITGAELRAIGLKSPPRTFVRAAQNPTTMPNTAPVNPGPSLPINRPRATGLFLCHQCGQTWRIERAGGAFTTRKITYCPVGCGLPMLPTKTTFAGLDAGCFDGIDKRLTQMLYQQWAANQHHEQDKHARFVDYLKEQLT